jgi:hypothetical protein
MEIKPEEENRLKKIASTNKAKINDVLKMYKDEYEKLEKEGLKDNVSHFAVNAVMNSFRRTKIRQSAPGKKVKPISISGFLLGDLGLWDKADQMRKTAKNYVDQNGVQAAIDAQLINSNNEILDQREHVYGRENPKYLEPLPPNLKVRSRTLFGMFRKNGDKIFKWTTIQTNDNSLARAWGKIKTFLPCQTTAIPKEEDDTEMRFSSSQAEDTMTVFKAVKEEMDVHKILMTLVDKETTPIKDVEKHHETYKDAWDRRIILKGIVAWIGIDRPNSWNAIYAGLMNPDNEEELVRILIPEHVPINFGELSEIVVFGRTKRSKAKDPETEKWEDADVRVDVFGIYPMPGLSTPKETSEAEMTEEREIEGWLS